MSPAAVCAARDEQRLLPHRAAESTITIYLTAPGLAVRPMCVMASDSIAAVKLRVQTSKGVVVRKQKLVFHGRELARNDCRIRDYGVSDGNVIHLVIRISDLRLITVETIHGSKFRFRVEPGRTVGYVKQQIARDSLHPAPPEDQRLIHEGEELDDRHLIHDVCRTDGAVIHLLVTNVNAEEPRMARDLEVSIVAEASPVPLPTRDTTGLIEPVIVNPKAQLPLALQDLVGAVLSGMEKGNAPFMSSEGTGGAYFMQDASGHGHNIAVFKPVDEEPMAVNNPRGLPVSSTGEGLKKGTRVSEGAFREVAAYLLDHPLRGRRQSSSLAAAGHGAVGFAGVPLTTLVRCMHKSFRQPADEGVLKLGSLQAFVKNCGSCEEMGPRAFPVQEVHKISVLDMRLANADRHAGNILVCKDDDQGIVSLVPIDHGYCLPESFEDCTFEWLYWPQSREPFNEETVDYIASLDAEEDIAILRFHGWEISSECARTLRVSTMLLKKGTERGLTAFDIGSVMCRETLIKESTIEEVVREAHENSDDGDEDAFLQAVSEIMDRRLDRLSSDRK